MFQSSRNSISSSSFRKAFDVLDADHDGKISSNDLKAFYASSVTTTPLTEDEIGAMISAADADRDGFVAYDEFERVVGARRSGMAVMEEAFRVMDRDGDGKVGFGDLKAYLELAGVAAGDEDVKVMIKMAGGDEAAGVCLDGFLKFFGR